MRNEKATNEYVVVDFDLNEFMSQCEGINEELISRTCFFAGCANQGLIVSFDNQDDQYVQIRARAKTEIEYAINKGYINFISGMALGFDTMCAEIVLELREKYSHISLICALPYKKHYKSWTSPQRKRHKQVLKDADIVRYVSKKYTENCMLERSGYLLNNSSLLIALHNGKSREVEYTINLATKGGLEVKVIDI